MNKNDQTSSETKENKGETSTDKCVLKYSWLIHAKGLSNPQVSCQL